MLLLRNKDKQQKNPLQAVLPTGIHMHQIWKFWYIFKELGI